MLSGCLAVWGILPVPQAGCVLLESLTLKGYPEEEHTQALTTAWEAASPGEQGEQPGH